MNTIYSSLSVNDRANADAASLFLKIRHDYFCYTFLKKALNEEVQRTDVSFSEMFGLDCNQTPDYMVVHNETIDNVEVFHLRIFEFAVTSSSDFADSKKGAPNDSKYQEPIEELRNEGYVVSYYPIILRLDKKYDDNQAEWAFYGYDIDLSDMHAEYKILSDQFYMNFHHLQAFKERDFEDERINSIYNELPYNRNKFFKTNLLNKMDVVSSYKNRLLHLINTFKESNDKITFVYNANTGTLNAYKTDHGMYARDLEDWINSDLDVDKIVNYIRFEYKKTGFETQQFEITTQRHKRNCFATAFKTHTTSIDISDNNYNERLEALGLDLITELRAESVGPETFMEGVPAPFDFDETLENAIKMIENPITDTDMLYTYENSPRRRNEILEALDIEVSKINSAQEVVYKPKSSFLCFIKPAGEVSQKNYQITTHEANQYLAYVKEQTSTLLKLLRNDHVVEPKTFANLSMMEPIRRQLEDLVQANREAKSQWVQTPECVQCYRGIIDFKDVKTKEAELLRSTTRAIQNFKAAHSKAVRTINAEEMHIRLPVPTYVSKDIKQELSRDHNMSDRHCTADCKTLDIQWDVDDLFNEYRDFLNELFCYTDSVCNFKLQFDGYSNSGRFLNELKEIAVNNIKKWEDYLSHTALGSTLEFNCKLFKSIAFMSTIPMKGKLVCIESAGLKDTILLIKGGKANQHASKAFKVITTIHPKSVNFYTCYNDPNSNWHVFVKDGKTFIETPWMRYQSGLIEHFHLLKYKLCNFMICMSEETKTTEIKLNKFALPIIASLNGRRKLEVLLHGFRQLVMNFRAQYANITKLFSGVVEASTDYTYYLVVQYILKVLRNFNKNLSVYLDPLTNESELNVTGWTIQMYCSRLLPKAAVDFKSELRNDIVNFFKTFNDCGIRNDTRMSDFEVSFDESPYNHDLCFSPQLAWLVGCYISDMIKDTSSESALYKDFKKVYNKNIFQSANNRGCRLDPDNDKVLNVDLQTYMSQTSSDDLRKLKQKIKECNVPQRKLELMAEYSRLQVEVADREEDYIFGRKGYQAYLDTFRAQDYDKLVAALNAPGPVSASSMLRSNKTSLYSYYRKNCNGLITETPTFSIHNKLQWGGPREIFAATVKTKITQQLAEGIFHSLCKQLPNEMISIPSNKRILWLHSTIHQRVDKDTYMVSLDYRRWGPHANFLKYWYMVLGMIDILPPSFVVFFQQLTELMEKKRVIIRRDDFKAVFNHAIVRDVLNHANLTFYENYVMIQEPHSFVMGIYNYLSSLLHSGSQLLFRHLLHISELASVDQKLDFYAIAHSDDAQGMIKCSTQNMCERVIKAYETYGKYLNHMQSNKKSQVDKRSSEVISILRIDRVIVSMLAKFAAGFSVSPSYKGYVNEVKDLTSKVIELVSNGATFNQAYSCYRMMVHYWSYYIYHFNKPVYNYPIEALGTPDEYPLLQLLYGTRVNFLSNYFYYRHENCKFQEYVKVSKNIDLIEGLKYNANARPIHKIRDDDYTSNIPTALDDLLKSDTILMCNFNTDCLLVLQIIARMRDPNFMAAMSGGHLSSGLSYLLKNNVKFVYSLFDDAYVPWAAREELIKKLDSMDNIPISSSPFDSILDDLKLFNHLPGRFEWVDTPTSLKPCTLAYEVATVRGLRSLSYRKMHCYLNEPQFRNFIELTPSERGQIELFNVISEGLSSREKDILAQAVCQEAAHTTYFYASLPTDKRSINNKSDLGNLISYNTLRGKFIPQVNEYTLPERMTDMEARCNLEAALLIFEMLQKIPEVKKANFLQNYSIKYKGEDLKIAEAIRKAGNDLNPYAQVLAYQLSFICRKPKIFPSLPLIHYTKRQMGVGSVWFGEGRIRLLTRESDINIAFMHEKVKSIHLNCNCSIEDLQYLMNELVLTGIQNHFYEKILSPKNDEHCIGFDDPSDMIPKIGRANMFRFISPDVYFHSHSINYPNLTSLDIRKVKDQKGNIYYIRLSKNYRLGVMLNTLNIESNKKWMEENINLPLPWFDPKKVKITLDKRPHVGSVVELGYSYVFNKNSRPSSMGGKTFDVRKYVPGISDGIVECILENAPESIRVPEENKMWQMLCKQYPTSFLRTIHRARIEERNSELNNYLHRLSVGDSKYIHATKTYLSDCMSIMMHEDMPRRANAWIMMNEFKINFSNYMIETIVSLVESSKLTELFNINVNTLFQLICLNRNQPTIMAFAREVINDLRSVNDEEYHQMQTSIGRPWSLLPKDPILIAYVIIQCCLNFEVGMNNKLRSLHPDWDNYRGYTKQSLKRKLLNSVTPKLLDLMQVTEYDVEKKRYKTTRVHTEISIGRSTGERTVVHFDRFRYTSLYSGDIPRFNDLHNTNYYTDPDEFYEDTLDEETNGGNPRWSYERRLQFKQEKGRRIIDTLILGDTFRHVDPEMAINVLSSTPYLHYIIKSKEILEPYSDWPTFQLVIHPDHLTYLISVEKGPKFVTHNGIYVEWKEYKEICVAVSGLITDAGDFRIIGVQPPDALPPVSAQLVQNIKNVIEAKDDIEIIKIAGTNTEISTLLLNKIMTSDTAIQEKQFKIYEPLGTFITDNALQALFDAAFPKTYLPLLKGTIKIPKSFLMPVKRLINDLPVEKQRIAARILRSISITNSESEIPSDELQTSFDFWSEYCKFLDESTEAEPDEFNEDAFDIENVPGTDLTLSQQHLRYEYEGFNLDLGD
uniref:RNA-dependent RNA polymerase n=1 Tax=Shayang ascaridia galli virus 1 TaxID=1923459 RepID=A0A1L3KPF1_9VIRU|nr:RNA-dependent RNA polymerase [Shayang ascaridia galli virus 1]